MILDRLTTTSHFKIKSPRWKDRVVGLAAHRVAMHNSIEILLEDKEGNRYWPDIYYVSGDLVKQCEMDTQRGVHLYLVPISSLEPLERSK